MTAIAYKIQDILSDFKLDIELFLDGIFNKNNSKKISESNAENTETHTHKSNVVNANINTQEDKNKEKSVNNQNGLVQNSKIKQKEDIKQSKLSFSLKTLRISKRQCLFFYDQMATLIESGVTLIDSLYLMLAQTKDKKIKKLYKEMIHHINAGMSLAESMYIFPHIFPKIQSALIEAAEKSGNLDIVLVELTENMEADQNFLRKIKGAMFYPLILICLALIMVSGMMTFIIPKIADMYEQSSVTLPILTQKIIDISHFIVNEWPIILIVVITSIIGLWLICTKTRFGKITMENIISITPVIGRIAKEKNLMLIASNMSMLMRSGVLIGSAFAITEKTIANLHYKTALKEIRHGVILGKEISQMMGLEDIKTQKFRENKLFPLQVAQLIHIGEKTGTISEMFLKIKNNYHKNIDYTLKNLSVLVEPIMIFIVAVLVGSILLAVMLPFFYIGTTIN